MTRWAQFTGLHSVTVSEDVEVDVPTQGFNVYGALSTASEFNFIRVNMFQDNSFVLRNCLLILFSSACVPGDEDGTGDSLNESFQIK